MGNSKVVASAELPWVVPEVIAWLESIIKPHWHILETGAGGSTVYFAKRAASVISFEHNAKWVQHVNAELVRRNLNHVATVIYSPEYPFEGLGELTPIDLAFIDGRGRVRSVYDAIRAVRPGGYLILDDSNRERYKRAVDMMNINAHRCYEFAEGIDSTTAWLC